MQAGMMSYFLLCSETESGARDRKQFYCCNQIEVSVSWWQIGDCQKYRRFLWRYSSDWGEGLADCMQCRVVGAVGWLWALWISMGNLSFTMISDDARTRRQCSFTEWRNLCFHTSSDYHFHCKAHWHKYLMQVAHHFTCVQSASVCVCKFSPELNSCCLPLPDMVSTTVSLHLSAPHHRLASLPRTGSNSDNLVIFVDTEQHHDLYPTFQNWDAMDKGKKKKQNRNKEKSGS